MQSIHPMITHAIARQRQSALVGEADQRRWASAARGDRAHGRQHAMTIPLLDVHERTIPAMPASAWLGLVEFVRSELLSPPTPVLRAILGVRTRPAWTISKHDGHNRTLRVEGRHRFARYAIEFAVSPQGADAVVQATSYAVFPGPLGWIYRRLVVTSRLHVAATHWLLRRVEQTTASLGQRATKPLEPSGRRVPSRP